LATFVPLRHRVLVHIAAIRNRSAGTANSRTLPLAPFTFYINGYRIAGRKCFIKRLVQKVVNMRPCSWRHLAQFLPDKHDLRALLLQLTVLDDIYALAGNKEGPIRKIEDRGGDQAGIHTTVSLSAKRKRHRTLEVDFTRLAASMRYARPINLFKGRFR
jgi:hypothetical protein